jgi:hypothetical protein
MHILCLYIGSGFYIDVLKFVLPGELQEIKEYLLMIEDPNIGRESLEKVTTMKLLDLLQDRDLLGINNISFIKKILELINQNFLLTEVNNYENQIVKVVDAKPRRQISGN